MRNFISVLDTDDPASLVRLCSKIKSDPFSYTTLGKNKMLGLVFFNPSLRTRMSTFRAAKNLGMSVLILNIDKESWKIETEDGAIMDGDKAEHIKEAVPVMSSYCDVLGLRSFAELKSYEMDREEPILNDFLQYSTVPILNLESCLRHPLQSLADMLTIEEKKKTARPKIVLTWAPHPKPLAQAVPNSFAEWCLAMGHDLTIAHPEKYNLHEAFTSGAKITHDQNEAFKDADFIYAKSWCATVPYGEHLEQAESWTIDEKKMALTSNAHFMHCLPLRRNVIATDAVVDGENSIVQEQAHNRVFSAQAALFEILKAL